MDAESSLRQSAFLGSRLALLREQGVTVWNSAPALMQLMVEAAHEDERLFSIRLVMLSGDWIPPSMPDRIRVLAPGATVVGLGGATEASIWSIWYEIPLRVPSCWTSIPYGHSMANQMWKVLDADLLRSAALRKKLH